MPELDSDALTRIVAFLRGELPGVRAIYLFGSAASGRLRADSDIDLAVHVREALGPDRRFDLAQACARRLGREVDLVDLRDAPLTLQAQVVGEGSRVYAADATESAFFENTVLSRYCAFNEERRPLLEMIARRGAIHA